MAEKKYGKYVIPVPIRKLGIPGGNNYSGNIPDIPFVIYKKRERIGKCLNSISLTGKN